MEDLQKMTTNVTTGKSNNSNNRNNDTTTIGDKQIKKVTLGTSGY
jgi:hypothetical protein